MSVQAARIHPIDMVRDVLVLAKPRLSGLVLMTAAVGMRLAPGKLSLLNAAIALVGITLIVASANTCNSLLERDADALMARTQNRARALEGLDVRAMYGLAMMMALVSCTLLAVFVNLLTAVLGMLAFVLYVGVYTPMKYQSTVALLLGAVPGAIPPLMGATSVANSLEPSGILLFAVLFFWQLPHFLAISLYLRDDYRLGGMKVFALVHGERYTKLAILLTSALMMPVTLALLPYEIANLGFAAAAIILNTGLIVCATFGIWTSSTDRWARVMFIVSIAYLPLLLISLMIGAR